MSTPQEILTKAADLIEGGHHAKYVYAQTIGPSLENSRECYCTSGAVNFAAAGDACQWTDDAQEAIELLDHYLTTAGVYIWTGSDRDRVRNRVFTWNDALDRTEDEVVEALRAAAAA